MSHSELEQLVRMANQVAANFSYHEDGVERTAVHLSRFWAPSMRAQIMAHLAAGGTGLSDAAAEAVRRLASRA